MSCCRRAAPVLLHHLNLLLAMYGGAAVVTAARLKWDPSTYVPVRQLFPAEYRVAAVFLAAAGFVLLLSAHISCAALTSPRRSCRRTLLILYAVLMSMLMVAEVAWLVWMGVRVAAWLQGPEAQHLSELLALRSDLQGILDFFSKWHPLPNHVKELMMEAEADAPRNLWVVLSAGALLALVQPLSAALSLVVARLASRAQRRISLSCATIATTATSTEVSSCEKPLLRTAYKNGRIVIL